MATSPWPIRGDRLEQLIRRTELWQPLLRCAVEEEIVALVELDEAELHNLEQAFRSNHQLSTDEQLQAWLQERNWDHADLQLHLARPEALQRFAEQRFGPGLEETFLQRKPQLDMVVYSLLRVQNEGLAREPWIQLSEGEISFPEAASRYSEGPEAAHKGVIGPLPLGQLQPELAERLRSLGRGELRAPEPFSSWWVLLRLEQLTPAKLDDAMRRRLLDEQLNAYLEHRCQQIRRGEQPEELAYTP